MSERLTEKQELFVYEYLKSFNATKAAIAAGYSEKTAQQIGSENLSKPVISSRIRAHMDAVAMSADEVLYHLAEIARGDIDDVVDTNGNLNLSKARATGKSKLIKKIKQRNILTADTDGEGSDITETEIEMHDRLKALEMLAKYHDLINKVRIDDWHTQAIQDIRSGNITFEALMESFDEDLATELFRAAGVPISTE